VANEEGDIFTIQAGRTFAILATNQMHDTTLATPALSANTLFVRTEGALWALANGPAPR